jgi:hypothetical protein
MKEREREGERKKERERETERERKTDRERQKKMNDSYNVLYSQSTKLFYRALPI